MAKTSKKIKFDESTLVRMLNSLGDETKVFSVSEGKISFITEHFEFIKELEELVKTYRPLLKLDLVDDPEARGSPFPFKVYEFRIYSPNKHKELVEKLYELFSSYSI